jgi:hexosaminidase
MRTLVAATAAVSMAITGSASASPHPRPFTIPALREWTGGHGTFALPKRPRIVAPRRLNRVARTLADDLRGSTAGRGEIHLALDGSVPRPEAYTLSVGKHGVRIAARTSTGVFWGTRTLLQLVHCSRRLPLGHARDWPRYPDRGLMIDNGRKYFTPKWIAREIKRLSYLKLNRLHLHFSDNQGFRIQSRTHPEAVSDVHLSQRDVHELIALGERYHVKLVPELDMPGHLQAALAKHPELQLADASGQRAPDKLDYTKPEARKFARDLIEEYMALFPAREWHMGADEFLSVILPPTEADYARYPQLEAYAKATYGPTANAKDGFLGFVNEIDALVRGHGKTLHVWNDGLDGGNAVKLRPDIVVEWWNNPAGPGSGPGPDDFIAQGHRVLNAGWFPTYYVSGSSDTSAPPRPDMGWAYEDWDVNRFLGAYYASHDVHEPEFVVPPGEPLNRGSELHVWNDDPTAETEAQIAAGIAPRLRVIAQKTWHSPLLVPDHDSFERLARRVGDG